MSALQLIVTKKWRLKTRYCKRCKKLLEVGKPAIQVIGGKGRKNTRAYCPACYQDGRGRPIKVATK